MSLAISLDIHVDTVWDSISLGDIQASQAQAVAGRADPLAQNLTDSLRQQYDANFGGVYRGAAREKLQAEAATVSPGRGLQTVLTWGYIGAVSAPRIEEYIGPIELGYGGQPLPPAPPIELWAESRGLDTSEGSIFMLRKMIALGRQGYRVIRSFRESSGYRGLVAAAFDGVASDIVRGITFQRRGKTVSQFRGAGGRFARVA